MADNAPDSLDPVAPWAAMLLAHDRAVRAIEADLRRARLIPLTTYDVLLELHAADGRLRMQDLGDRVVLSRTRVSRLVGELEAQDLVRREPDPDDGRATFASITAAGVEALREAAPVYLDGIERHFTSHLTTAEQRSIATGLRRVVAAHDATRPVTLERTRSSP